MQYGCMGVIYLDTVLWTEDPKTQVSVFIPIGWSINQNGHIVRKA